MPRSRYPSIPRASRDPSRGLSATDRATSTTSSIHPSIHPPVSTPTRRRPPPPRPTIPRTNFTRTAPPPRAASPPPPRARASPRVPSAPSSPTRGARPSSRTSSPSRTARVVVAIALATRRVASVLFFVVALVVARDGVTARARIVVGIVRACAARATSRVTSTSRVCIYLHAIDRSDTARTVSSTVRAGCAVTSRRRARAVPCGVTVCGGVLYEARSRDSSMCVSTRPSLAPIRGCLPRRARRRRRRGTRRGTRASGSSSIEGVVRRRVRVGGSVVERARRRARRRTRTETSVVRWRGDAIERGRGRARALGGGW